MSLHYEVHIQKPGRAAYPMKSGWFGTSERKQAEEYAAGMAKTWPHNIYIVVEIESHLKEVARFGGTDAVA